MEKEFLAWLRDQLAADERLPLGLTDDAALVRWPGDDERLIVTTDLLTDGVDFRVGRDDPQRIGRKALAVNLSDLAAMAATPIAAFLSLAIPRSNGAKLTKQLYRGLLPLAREYGVAIGGGDTNTWDGPLVINVTLLGEVGPRGPLQRSGARVGDRVLVTGELGGSILGKHFDFQPRVREALELHEQFELHAGMDISDGLSLDASRLAKSSGCGIVLQLDRIPIASAARELSEKTPGVTPVQHALQDGEDFELILVLPPNEAERVLQTQPCAKDGLRLTDVGYCIQEPGLWQQSDQGPPEPLEPRGYEH